MSHRDLTENHLQAIGSAITGHPDFVSRAMLYAEVEDGVISADLFFEVADGVRFKFAPESLQEEVYAYWKHERSEHEWRVLRYVVQDGRMSVDLRYPDEIGSGEDLSDRRPRAVAEVFPRLAIDYSRAR